MKKKKRNIAQEQFPTLEYAATRGLWKAIETYTFAAISCSEHGFKNITKENAYLYSFWIRSAVMTGNRAVIMQFLEEKPVEQVLSCANDKKEFIPLCYAIAFMYFHWAEMHKAEEFLRIIQANLQEAEERLQEYNVLSLLLIANIYRDKGDLASSNTFLYKSLHAAQQVKDSALLAIVYQQIINYQILMGEYEKIESNLQHALSHAAATESEFIISGIHVTQAYYHIHKGETAYSIRLLEQSIQVYEELDYSNGLAGAYHALGVAKISLGVLHEAVEALLQAEFHFRKIHDRHGIMFAYTNISHIYSHAQQYQQALEYAEKAYTLSLELGLNTRILDYAILLSTISAHLKDSVSAEQWLFKAEELAHVHGHAVQKAQTILAKATILYEQKQYQEARAICINMLAQADLSPLVGFELWCIIIECSLELKDSSTAKKWFKKVNDYIAVVTSVARKGRFMTLQAKHALYCTKNWQLAEELLQEIRTIYQQESLYQFLEPIQQMLLELYETTQRWEDAVRVSRELIALKERVASEKGTIQIEFMRKEIELKKTRQQLATEQQRIEQLQADITRKSNEMYVLTAQLVEKNQLLTKTVRTISEVKNCIHNTACEKLHSLHAELQQCIATTPEQQSVADSLRHIDDNLAHALLKICPQLTPMELKICSLLKLQLTTKQVAGLLHTSVRNIENHRYRIRKKLFLQTEEHLPTFFARVVHLWNKNM